MQKERKKQAKNPFGVMKKERKKKERKKMKSRNQNSPKAFGELIILATKFSNSIINRQKNKTFFDNSKAFPIILETNFGNISGTTIPSIIM